MDDLFQQIQTFFLEKYLNGLSNPRTFLAFEPLGCIIDPEEYKDPNTNQFVAIKAEEAISGLVDRVPSIGDIFLADLNHVSTQYISLVNGATFNEAAFNVNDPSAYLARLNELTNAAKETLHDASRMSIRDVGVRYFPADTQPSTWYDAQSPIWIGQEFQANKQVLPSENPLVAEYSVRLQAAAPPLPSPTRFTWRWWRRRKNNAPTTNSLADKRVVTPETAPEPVEGALPSMPTQPVAKKLEEARPAENQPLVLGDDSPGQAMSVEAISFSYCIVQVSRTWLDTGLIDNARLWYSLAQPMGSFSSGSKDTTNSGTLRAIPTAFIIIKDLKITSSSWSVNDLQNAQNSTGLGAFNLLHSVIDDTNALVNPSLQIIGWLCEVSPQMPLTSDPNLRS